MEAIVEFFEVFCTEEVDKAIAHVALVFDVAGQVEKVISVS